MQNMGWNFLAKRTAQVNSVSFLEALYLIMKILTRKMTTMMNMPWKKKKASRHKVSRVEFCGGSYVYFHTFAFCSKPGCNYCPNFGYK
uniref:Uncharacterized protein n=1 Tax=Cannabis sativa TaxID=3483 RepID=A0A803R815_CANSA